jgi:hypothetical protein
MSNSPIPGVVVIVLGLAIFAVGLITRFRARIDGRPVDRATAVMILGTAFAAAGLFALVRP